MKYFSNIDRLERLSWNAMGIDDPFQIVRINVYDNRSYMICPHPSNKELVAFYENEVYENRMVKHQYRLLKKDFNNQDNWSM